MSRSLRFAYLPFVVALLGPVLSAAQAPEFPWRAGDVPPSVAGLRLGDTRASIDSVLGRPDGVQDLGDGRAFFDYEKSHGLIVGFTPADGVALIQLLKAAAGQIDSIQVGDSLSTAARRWGAPAVSKNHVAIYRAGWWGVVLYLDDSNTHVKMLTLGRVVSGK
jgi:hypothetical protein